MDGTDPTLASDGNEGPGGPASRLDATRLKQGDTVGSRFVVDERLREDVLGIVYRAVDEKSGKKIELLMLDPAIAVDKPTTDRLRAQVKSATDLAHKNIISTFGMGKEGRRRYVAREFVDGQTLADLLEKKATAGKHFTLKGAYNLIAHICNGLQHALPGMAHGTLRPSAVLINRTGRVKVADFGLAELRPAMVARRTALTRWDRPCLPESPPAGLVTDDVYALGILIYSLLAARPPESPAPTLPDDVARRLPPELAELLRRCVDPAHDRRFRDPNELKTELLHLVETSRGLEGQRTGAEGEGRGAASIEVIEEHTVPGVKQVNRTPAPVPEKRPRAKEAGGFVIPELRPPGHVEDDGTKARWLVQRDGTDYGPFTSKQVVEQLFKEEITAEVQLYDIETDRRLALSEFSVFDEALVAWLHEKAEREKRRAEEAAAAAARRRNRVLLTVVGLVLLVAGGGAGGYLWWKSSLPTPVKAHLGEVMTHMRGALPTVRLPEELPETPAEVQEKKEKETAVRNAAAARAEQRQIDRERALAASSNLDVGSGTGAGFDRGSFDTAVASRNGRLMKCLEDEARRDPDIKTLTVKITIIPKGDLIDVHMAEGSKRGTSCARAALAGLKVAPFDGTNVKVSLPFTIR